MRFKMSANTTPEQEYNAYAAKVANAFVKVAQATDARHSTAAGWIQMAGLGIDITSEGNSGLKVPEIKTDPDNGPHGYPRAEFTQAALDKHDAGRLADLKVFTYSQVQRMSSRGSFATDEQRDECLTELGLPKPATKTDVEAHVTGVGNVRFTVEGKTTVNEMTAKLSALASNPIRDAIKAAFPDASGLGSDVSGVYLYPRTEWPKLA